VMVGADGTVRATTPAAAAWLDDLATLDSPRTGELPTVVRAVVERIWQPAREAGGNLLPRARVRTPSGRWLVIHSAPFDNDDGSAAVVIEPAAGVLAPLVVAAYGFTAREAEVARRVLAGHPRKVIATDLRISLHTVTDHLKAIFDKAGVSSTGQLRSRVFSEHFPTPARRSGIPE